MVRVYRDLGVASRMYGTGEEGCTRSELCSACFIVIEILRALPLSLALSAAPAAGQTIGFTGIRGLSERGLVSAMQ